MPVGDFGRLCRPHRSLLSLGIGMNGNAATCLLGWFLAAGVWVAVARPAHASVKGSVNEIV
jgi:hypothetical protein